MGPGRSRLHAVTYRQVGDASGDRPRVMALGCRAGPGAILSTTRLEWCLRTSGRPSADSSRCRSTHRTFRQVEYILPLSRARRFVETSRSTTSHGSRSGCLTLERRDDDRARRDARCHDPLRLRPRKEHGSRTPGLEARARRSSPDDLTIIYTSGTTGPRGVVSDTATTLQRDVALEAIDVPGGRCSPVPSLAHSSAGSNSSPSTRWPSPLRRSSNGGGDLARSVRKSW